ncbi:MAG: purine-binding chemotaxis protein CheW [Bacteroidales bacterium]|nr:purine-binding chemotaxis protein CheW [Bacteroidales bacterium]
MTRIKTDQEVLRERVQKLSQLLTDTHESSEQTLHVVGFYLAPEQYCIETAFLKEVLMLKDLTSVPGVPLFIQGIINIRGQVMSLMNLRQFLDLKETGISEQNKIMIVHHKGLEIGILVDRISGIFSINTSSIDPAPLNLSGQGAEFVRGVTREGVIVLDCAALLESNKILIQDIKNQ